MSPLVLYVAGPRAVAVELNPDTLEPAGVIAGEPGLIRLEPSSDPPSTAPLCIECRRPARLSINGEDLCEACLGELRTALNAARDRVDELEARLNR